MKIQLTVRIFQLRFNLGADVDPTNRNIEVKKNAPLEFIKTIKTNKTSSEVIAKHLQSKATPASNSISSGNHRSGELFKRMKDSVSSSELNSSSISHPKHLRKSREILRGTHTEKNTSTDLRGFLSKIAASSANFEKNDDHLVSKKSTLFQKIKGLSKRFQHKNQIRVSNTKTKSSPLFKMNNNVMHKFLGKMAKKKESESEEYFERVDENFKEIDDYLFSNETHKVTRNPLKTKHDERNSITVSEEIEESSNTVEINIKIRNKHRRRHASKYNDKIVDASKIIEEERIKKIK